MGGDGAEGKTLAKGVKQRGESGAAERTRETEGKLIVIIIIIYIYFYIACLYYLLVRLHAFYLD
jgi:hypothetical protein